MNLLIDIGNTRIKWALSDEGSLERQEAASHAEWTVADCKAAWASLPTPQRVLVGNVAGERMRHLVRETANALWGVNAEFIESAVEAGGIRNAYPEYLNLGVDRWLAMIGAHAMQRRAVCVVSIGTAATIDGVDASGRHLGGLIVPGPDLMVESLMRGTSEIARRAETGSIGSGVFANNTLGAIRQGASQAVAALIDRAIDSLRKETNAEPVLVMTGGASTVIGPLVSAPHTVVPDLVLRGLAIIARD